MVRYSAIMFVIATIGAAAYGDVSLPEVLSDHMVLQRDRAVPVWGTAEAGESIRVTFRGKSVQTTADPQGHWQVQVAAGEATATPQELVVTGKNTLRVRDVLVGEVWICSGQSNMEYPMKRQNLNGTPPPPPEVKDVAAEECATAHEPDIRFLRVERKLNEKRLPTDGWHAALPGEALEHFSAPGYFFGKELHAQLQVPIGLIESAWAGSRIEPWLAPGSVEGWGGTTLKAATTMPGRLDGSPVGNYYTKLVEPLAPFAVRGVIWYQGESNIIVGNDGMRYVDKFRALIGGWRAAWHEPGMTFVQVQIAPYLYSRRKDPDAHSITSLPEFWEAQRAAARLPNVGLVDITDIADNLTNIHPWNKWEVGRRLGSWALANVYGRKDVVGSGPVYRGATFDGARAIVSFDEVDGGLQSRDGKPLSDFELAGADGKFVSATAEIQGQSVVVISPEVAAARAVRFGWREDARPNLMNKAGWPAEAFRSDGPARDAH